MNQTEEIIAMYTSSCRIPCPECSKDRKKSKRTDMSVTVNSSETLYQCHHCGLAGCIPTGSYLDKYTKLRRTPPKPDKVTPIPTQYAQDNELIKRFFTGRGIEIKDMNALPQMTTGYKFFYGVNRELPAIGFIYGGREQPDAIKWRAVDEKLFSQSGAARSFYGVEKLDENPDTLVIVEGEADVIALATIGVVAISCPNGAPQKVHEGQVSPEEDVKFSYVWDSRTLINEAKTVILAVDQDEPGNALAEELARRIDRAKCKRVKFPDGCKDPTDVIKLHGADAMKRAISTAESLPLQGVYEAKDYGAALRELYSEGHGKGVSVGIPVIDTIYTVKPGYVTVVTGQPNSGKSEMIDQFMVNLSSLYAWKFAVASFENPPAVHLSKLIEKLMGRPFFDGMSQRLSEREMEIGLQFCQDHFTFLQQKDGSLATIESILERGKQAIMRMGIRSIVIDPYNYLERPKNMSEHDFITEMLTKVVAFAQAHQVHIFFVAHPAKMYARDDGSYAIPTGQNISGSASWFSKPDFGLTVHRDAEGVQLHCWKSRFKWIAQIGKVDIKYDIPSGRYYDPNHIEWGKTEAVANRDSMINWKDFEFDDLEF